MNMATCSMCGGKLPKGQQNPCKKCGDPSGIKAFDFIQENKRGYLNG